MPPELTKTRSDAAFHLEPLPATFGATVTGVRLGAISETAFGALYKAWVDYGLLIFPAQKLARAEQIELARRFGPLEFEFSEFSNVAADSRVLAPDSGDQMLRVLEGNMRWHQDFTYVPVQAKGAVFSSGVAPSEGGQTAFADMAAAYDALSAEEQQRLAGLTALHSVVRSQAKVGGTYKPAPSQHGLFKELNGKVTERQPPCRPLVRVHPETGRKLLAIGRHAYAVSGLSEEESEELLARLTEEACQPPRVWEHQWTAGDLVIWDNRRLMHRSRPWDMSQPRVMWHSRIAGDPFADAGLEMTDHHG